VRIIHRNGPNSGPNSGPSERRGRVALACERAFFAVATGCLLAYAAACAHGSFFQSRDQAAFEQALRASIEHESHDHGDWSEARVRGYQQAIVAPVLALGRLDVPDASVSVMLLEGTDELTLNRAVGHIKGTARPGETGNVGIAGHRDSFFRGLQYLEVGDDLSLTTLNGVARYEVETLDVVNPDAVEVLAPKGHDALTLVTCYPFYYVGDAPRRFIVHARQVGFEPWSSRSVLAWQDGTDSKHAQGGLPRAEGAERESDGG
jgi:LPXTG-site transpeptidase (sortase) family protein